MVVGLVNGCVSIVLSGPKRQHWCLRRARYTRRLGKDRMALLHAALACWCQLCYREDLESLEELVTQDRQD